MQSLLRQLKVQQEHMHEEHARSAGLEQLTTAQG